MSLCLFKAIHGFIEFANPNLPLSFEIRRKLHAYISVKVTIEESIVDIKLMQVLALGGRKSKKSAYSNHFSNESKGLCII